MENSRTTIKITRELLALLPPHFASALALKEEDELELSEATPGVWVVMRKDAQQAIECLMQQKNCAEERHENASEKELALLKKLESIKFDQRIPNLVNKGLTVAERKTLEGLIKKRLVTVYREKKYAKTGVYNIPRQVYAELRKKQACKEIETPSNPDELLKFLEENGYMTVNEEEKMKTIAFKLEEQKKAGEIIGTRGFDRTFYIMKKKTYDALLEKARKAIEKGGTPSQVAETLKITETLARTMLEIMKEEGEAIEKQKNMFYTA
ncbi:hypothetical protein HY992_05920 [Candidatus Micrarchaeota archaeon]|nr:hypothetical protein [Candidatus Micrarchaeota archaeon]